VDVRESDSAFIKKLKLCSTGISRGVVPRPQFSTLDQFVNDNKKVSTTEMRQIWKYNSTWTNLSITWMVGRWGPGCGWCISSKWRVDCILRVNEKKLGLADYWFGSILDCITQQCPNNDRASDERFDYLNVSKGFQLWLVWKRWRAIDWTCIMMYSIKNNKNLFKIMVWLTLAWHCCTTRGWRRSRSTNGSN